MSKAKFIRKINYFYLLLILCFGLGLFFVSKLVFAQTIVSDEGEIGIGSYVSTGDKVTVKVKDINTSKITRKWSGTQIDLKGGNITHHYEFESTSGLSDISKTVIDDSYTNFSAPSDSNKWKYIYNPREWDDESGECYSKGQIKTYITDANTTCEDSDISKNEPQQTYINYTYPASCMQSMGTPQGENDCFSPKWECDRKRIIARTECIESDSFKNMTRPGSNQYTANTTKINSGSYDKTKNINQLRINREGFGGYLLSPASTGGYSYKTIGISGSERKTVTKPISLKKTYLQNTLLHGGNNSDTTNYRIQILKENDPLSSTGGKIGKGLLISKDIGLDFSNKITSKFTISMWVKKNEDGNLFSMVDKITNNEWHFNALNDNNRNLITITCSGNDTTIYIDGEKKESKKIKVDYIYIGHYAGKDGFEGIIDELYIYKEALDAEQVKELAQTKLTKNGYTYTLTSTKNNLENGKYKYELNNSTGQIIIDSTPPKIETGEKHKLSTIPLEKVQYNFTIHDTTTDITECTYSRHIDNCKSGTCSGDGTGKIEGNSCSITGFIDSPKSYATGYFENIEFTGEITITGKDIINTVSKKFDLNRKNDFTISGDKNTMIANNVEKETVEISIVGERNSEYTIRFYTGEDNYIPKTKRRTSDTGFLQLDFDYQPAANHEPLLLKVVATDNTSTGILLLKGMRKPPQIPKTIIDLNGSSRTGLEYTGTKIIQQGQQGICMFSGENFLFYTGNQNAIGKDYCIVKNGNTQKIVGFKNINTGKNMFEFIGDIINHQYILSPEHNLFNTNIFSNTISIKDGNELILSLTEQQQSEQSVSIHNKNLLAFYDFEKILIADSKEDFGAIQGYKGWSYWRTTGDSLELEELQYDTDSKQWLVSIPVQDYDGLFVKADTLNPGKDINNGGYGDVVLKWETPIQGKIEIQIELEDAISYCGNGIKYQAYKDEPKYRYFSGILDTNNSYKGTKSNTILNDEPIYFIFNSLGDNNCDTTNYRIKIYQLPETNMVDETIITNNGNGALFFTQNKGAVYLEDEGIKGSAFGFGPNIGNDEDDGNNQPSNTNESYLRIGTGFVNDEMSTSFWIKPEALVGSGYWPILVKTGSYGIVVSTKPNNSGDIVVTNQTTQQRYNTNVKLDEDERNHIGRSYNGQQMKLYKNGKLERRYTIEGTIPINTSSVNVGRSPGIGQFQGIIDQLYIYSGAQSDDLFRTLHQFSLSRETPNRRNLLENKIAFENGQYDGQYSYTITGGDNSTGTSLLIDFSGPTIQKIHGLTGLESQDLIITGTLFDSGTNIDRYNRYYIIGDRGDSFEEIITSESDSFDFEIIIPAEDEPITGSLTIVAWDSFGHESQQEFDIERINTGPIIGYNQISEYKAKIGSNIKFTAMAIDTGSNLTYQRYSGTGCENILTGETNQSFITGSLETRERNFSFRAFDEQGLSSDCRDLTGIWEIEGGFTELILKCEGHENGTEISCDLQSKLDAIGIPRTGIGKKIILEGQKGSCQFTNNAKTRVTYTRSGIDQGNDSCIVELDDGEHILLAFTNIHTGFLNKRIRPFQTETISNNSPIDALSHIYTTGIDNFQFERLWKVGGQEQDSGSIGLDDNLIRKYSLDRIKITDSTKHFSKFPGEYSWRYFWDNGSTTGKLYFSPKLQSRIINEPLQDYEYINLSKDFVYPGSAKYGKVIYERTSNISGDIEIEVEIENKNPVHCTNTDGIIYAIKKGNEYSNSTQIYQKNLIELNDTSTIGSKISIGEKLYFIIDSKNDNECDKIGFNAEVYLSPIKDYSNSGVDLQISGVNYNNSHSELGGSYSFSNNQSFLNIGTINKQTGLSFSFWINTNSTNNQSIINKQGSYGLAFKDGKLKVTTDGGRRYETNSKTTESLTNGKRNHLMWTYDGINMYIYINGQLSRSQKIIGYYPSNNNPTYIGRSLNNGQLVGSIDELYVFNKFINSKEAELIYATNIRKIDGEKREFSFKQEKLEDGKYTFTGYINSGSDLLLSGNFTGEVKVDNDPPVLEILGSGDNTQDLSAEQGKELSIWLSGIDLGSSISGYKYSYKTGNNNFPNLGNTINRTGGNIGNDTITLPAENNPTSGQIQVKIRDENNNDETYTASIEWTNIAPEASDLEMTGYEGSIITFFASGYDPGGIKSYQRYSGENCLNILTGETNQSFSTGRNEPTTETFSYKIWDEQGLNSCATATGIRENVPPKSSDLYVTSDGNYQITFVVDAYDPGGTTFSGQLFSGNINCDGDPIIGTVTTVGTGAETTTGIEFTVSSELSGTYSYSYQIRDAQGLTGVNKNKSDRECQIATGHWPFINPIAYNFTISDNVGNSLVTGNRLTGSTKPEHRGQLTAEVLSGYKGYCNIVNQRIFFQPEANQTGTGYCEIKITDSNNRSSSVKGFAENIKTTAPETIIEVNNDSFTLTGEDIQYSYYKILTGVRLASSCGSEEYTGYDHSSTGITIDFGSNIYKTVCYYSEDSHGNTENPKSKLFTNTSEETPLIINFNSAEFMKDLFIATITNNKVVSGNIQGLNPSKDLNLNIGTHTITGAFTETNGKKTVRINLLHNNQNFTQDHTFQIDQTAPSRPNIYETSENNLYHIIKRNPSTDNHSGSGIKGYNYEIWNQHVTLYTGFTSANYLNIAKSQYQLNPRIGIKINAEDNVGNISSRSQDKIITIQKESESQTQETIQTPNQFSFNKTTSAKPGNLYTSNEIVIAGLSPNIKIPISLSNGSLFINDVKAENNSSTVKNGDIVYIQLRASENHSDTNIATLFANGVSATYTIVTENKSSSTTSFLEEFRRLLEQLQKTDSKDEDKPVENTEIDSSRRSAPHTAPNGKIYNLYKTIDDRYSSHNFVIKRYFSTLQEMKNHIDKNNPK